MKPKTKGKIIMAVAAFVAVIVIILSILLRVWLDKLYFNWLIK